MDDTTIPNDSMIAMDRIIYPVCKLCRDHEREGFIAGIKIGMKLYENITGCA